MPGDAEVLRDEHGRAFRRGSGGAEVLRQMELEGEVVERVGAYESLSRWEKSELGRYLRRLGLSYGEIMDLIPVKKSTLATWCRDVKLTEEQIAAIEKRRAPQPGIPRNTNWRGREEVRELRLIARDIADDLLEHGVCTVKMRRPADAWNVVMEWIDVLASHFGLDAARY